MFPLQFGHELLPARQQKNDLMAFNLSQRTSNIQEIADNRGVFHSQKSSYTPKKKSEKSEKSKDFFEDLKSVHLIWE